MDTIDVGVIGTGWCGRIRAATAAASPLVGNVHVDYAELVADDIVLTTTNEGNQFPLSTMPGEAVGHVFAGPMERETQHFLECVGYRRKVLVTPHEARQVMEVYLAADLSAARHEPVKLPF